METQGPGTRFTPSCEYNDEYDSVILTRDPALGGVSMREEVPRGRGRRNVMRPIRVSRRLSCSVVYRSDVCTSSHQSVSSVWPHRSWEIVACLTQRVVVEVFVSQLVSSALILDSEFR